MTKLDWCKVNAPEALKGESDDVLLSLMGSAYDRYCDSKDNRKCVAHNLTLKQMCEQFTDMWLYLINVTYDDTGRIKTADVLEAWSQDNCSEGMLKHLHKNDYEEKLWANPEVVNLDE